jgi:hypothetical protein
LLTTPRTFPPVVSTTSDVGSVGAAAAAGAAKPGNAAAAVPHNDDLRIARRLTENDCSLMLSSPFWYRRDHTTT